MIKQALKEWATQGLKQTTDEILTEDGLDKRYAFGKREVYSSILYQLEQLG